MKDNKENRNTMTANILYIIQNQTNTRNTIIVDLKKNYGKIKNKLV